MSPRIACMALFFLCAKHIVEITRAHHVYMYKICKTSTSDDLKEVGIGEIDQPGHRILRLCNILISCEFGTWVGRVAWGVNNCTRSQHAYASTTIVHPPSFKGTEVILNVWEPLVEPHCFSLAQLWLINTGLAFPYNSSDGLLNSIEAGWQVLYEIISEIFNYFLQNFVHYCLQSASAGRVWIFPPPSQFQLVARSLPMMHLPAPKSCIFMN